MAFSFKKCSVSWCNCRITWTRSVRCRRKLGWKKSISSANWWSWTLEETYSGDDFATGVHFIQNGRGVRSKIIKVLIQIRLTNGQQPNISAEFFIVSTESFQKTTNGKFTWLVQWPLPRTRWGWGFPLPSELIRASFCFRLHSDIVASPAMLPATAPEPIQ